MNNDNVSGDYDFFVLSETFRMLITNPELIFQLLNVFPMPVQVFAPDGMLVFSNRAFLEINNVTDVNLIVGVYNLLNDPVCDELYGHDLLEKAFQGETISWTETISMPIQDLINRGVVKERPYESAFASAVLFPIWDDGKVVCVVNIFNFREVYRGQPDVAKAKEYIDHH